ncbi:hypothetical protein QG37_02105 [Candidozyma auris]|uniref:Uncharacterized protein n=1 Tax=Candidozyma auris TaxID=498019 RepID=A0A0L0P4Q7_CANAR|nr:hypothetical protein QG37_02105 [[Candida] auris]
MKSIPEEEKWEAEKKKKSIEIRIGMEKEIKFEAQMVPDTRTLHELLSV